jgi:S1-C subfamily serine protease
MLGLFALAAAVQPPPSRPSPYLFEGSSVVRVVCVTANAESVWGTAFYLGAGLYMTAEHVVEKATCTIDDAPVTVEYLSQEPDYAIIKAAHFPPYRVVTSCERLQAGERYIATGYAGTDRDAVAQTVLTATGVSDQDQTAEANGSLVQGMSGGPVADLQGAVHAINTWQQADGAPYGGVTEIADTLLCKR